jgi:hypothetical protein
VQVKGALDLTIQHAAGAHTKAPAFGCPLCVQKGTSNLDRKLLDDIDAICDAAALIVRQSDDVMRAALELQAKTEHLRIEVGHAVKPKNKN